MFCSICKFTVECTIWSQWRCLQCGSESWPAERGFVQLPGSIGNWCYLRWPMVSCLVWSSSFEMGEFRAAAIVFLSKHLLIESERRAIPGLQNRAVPQVSSKTDFSEGIALTQNKMNLPPWTPLWEIRHSGLCACLLLGLLEQQADPGSLLRTVPFFHGLVCLQVSQPPMQGLMWRWGGFFQCTWTFLKLFSRKFGFK